MIALTGEQIRAARALARIEQTVLAEITGLSLETIKRVERIRGPVNVNLKTLGALVRAFEGLGIIFDPYGGLRTTYSSRSAQGLVEDDAPLERLIYVSRATDNDEKVVNAVIRNVVDVSARRNALLGVTGVLLAYRGQYLQVLEGPVESVGLLYSAIRADPRHQQVHLLERIEITVRVFGSWTMRAGVIPFQAESKFPELGAAGPISEPPPVETAAHLLRLVRNMDQRLSAGI